MMATAGFLPLESQVYTGYLADPSIALRQKPMHVIFGTTPAAGQPVPANAYLHWDALPTKMLIQQQLSARGAEGTSIKALEVIGTRLQSGAFEPTPYPRWYVPILVQYPHPCTASETARMVEIFFVMDVFTKEVLFSDKEVVLKAVFADPAPTAQGGGLDPKAPPSKALANLVDPGEPASSSPCARRKGKVSRTAGRSEYNGPRFMGDRRLRVGMVGANADDVLDPSPSVGPAKPETLKTITFSVIQARVHAKAYPPAPPASDRPFSMCLIHRAKTGVVTASSRSSRRRTRTRRSSRRSSCPWCATTATSLSL